MLKIYLARHGQDEDNANGILNGQRDMPLTKIGLDQATQVAEKIESAGLTFDYIFSSPLQRAYKTAEIIADELNNQKPIVLDDLIERNFGIMTGLSKDKIDEMCAPDIIKTETIDYFLNPEGAETFPQVLERVGHMLNELSAKYEDGNILLVTHGDTGKMIYAKYYNLPWQDVLSLFHFGNSELLLLSKDSQAGQAHVFKILQHNN